MMTNALAQVKFIQPNMKNPDEQLVYIGIQNYFLIQNTNGTKILSIQCKEGKIEKITDTTFNFKITNASINGIQFSYTWVKNGKLQKNIVYPVLYRTATVPDIARLRLGSKSNGKISLAELKMVNKLSLDDKDFKTKITYNILCEVSCKPSKSSDMYVFNIRNGDLQGNPDFQELLSKVSKGDKIRFDKIKVIGNNKTARPLESVTFLIE